MRARTRMWLLAGMLGLGVWLVGCASAGAERSLTTPMPPGQSELPTPPGQQTVTPAKGTGNDAPVSATVSSGATPTTAESKGGGTGMGGVVRDVNKQPIAHAVVVIVKGTVEFPERSYLTNEKGEYTIAVSPGSFTVSVNAEGYAMAQKEATVAEGKLTPLDFELEKE